MNLQCYANRFRVLSFDSRSPLLWEEDGGLVLFTLCDLVFHIDTPTVYTSNFVINV